MLIIGCGNRQRGDDAAGLLAAEKLSAFGIAAHACSGEPAELIEAWAGSDDVVVIDAVVTGAPLGTVHVWDGHQLPKFQTAAHSTHGLGVAEAIPLARVLSRLPAKLRVFGIEGARFGVRSAVSLEVERGVEETVKQIVREARP